MFTVRGVSKFRREVLAVAAAVVIFVVSAEVELFERFYELSRDHEDWELDEAFSFFLAASLALPVVFFSLNRRLSTALKEQISAERAAKHASRHDALTGLYNRRHLADVLNRMVAAAEAGAPPPAVLVLDLDRFKPVNDLRGHEAGDELLCAIAARLNALPGEDIVACRLGGDEFAVLIGDCADAERAAAIARRILTSTATRVAFDGWATSISCSIGVMRWRPGLDGATLLRNADQALYKAKQNGRAQYAFFDADLGAAVKRRARLEAELPLAIEEGQIVPYFQPLMRLSDGNPIGFEVLARWHHPELGVIPPDSFIEVAEDLGVIGPMSWQLLSESCRQAQTWDSRYFLSFNLSPRQLKDDDLISKIDRVLSETGFDPRRLELEITENAVIEDLETAKQSVEALKTRGIRISLDDFGTGFSSLATLTQLPFDSLKIDRSFVSGMDERSQSGKIVTGIIALAKSLELPVTAEGIESDNDLSALQAVACERGQGYFFERPMPSTEVAAWLARPQVAQELRQAKG